MFTRRKVLQLGAAVAGAAATFTGRKALASHKGDLAKGGLDFSHLSGVARKSIPTACALCVSRCPALGYVEMGRVVKIEGHPQSIRTMGKVCARGQAGFEQIYDPDRILYPLKRVGKRGEGKWTQLHWSDALDELAGRLKPLRDSGHPEKFMFHHGWISASMEKLIGEIFLPAFGTATHANHTCLGQGARRTAHELTWGEPDDNWDFDNTGFILNFGSNIVEAHINHVAMVRRLAASLVDRRVRMVTFDVRLSNTASKSQKWIPIKPGTDLAVILAMCHVVMSEDLYRGEGEAFLEFCKVTESHEAPVADKITALKEHLSPYTPEWAEKISGVKAQVIRDVAVEFATTKPACVINSRGATAHYNGVETERAIQMLAAITGNIDNPGGRVMSVKPEWEFPSNPKGYPKPRRLDILDGMNGDVALPTNGVGHQVFKAIKDGGAGRPDVYMWYCYNPVYANGEVQENIDVLKDESLIPYTVCVTPFYDESAAFADLILPDTTYLEKYDFEDAFSPTQVPEYYIRQPLVDPLDYSRDFGDVCCELAERMGFPLDFETHEEFVELTCEKTAVVKKAGGFEYMKKHGVYHDPEAKPRFNAYKKIVPPEVYWQKGVLKDLKTGVYWNWAAAGLGSEKEAWDKGYSETAGAYKGYVGQKIGEEVYAGFRPGVLNKSGYFEIYSSILGEKGFSPLPAYVPIPEHQSLKPDEMILITYKVNLQTLSRTQNCRWLTELYHDNPALIHPVSAEARGIENGDRIKVKSNIGEVEATAKVTHTIIPGTIAISTHCGRWEYGRYAANKWSPRGVSVSPREELKWWEVNGTHPNWIIPNSPEPISGQQRWMDTVVTVAKA